MGAIKYDTHMDEMIYDPPKTNVQVIDVDCQGLANLSVVSRRFEMEFPITYKKYVNSCIAEKIKLGDVYITEEKGYKLALIVTVKNRVGLKDAHEDVINNTINCVGKLSVKLPYGSFSSGILNRHTGTWMEVAKFIHKINIHWTIHKN